MSPDIKCKTCIISFILLISSLSFFAISPSSVKAQGDTAETLYFSTVNLTEYYETYLPAEMTPTLTDFENASYFPPTIDNSEDFASWFLFWFLYKSIDIGLDGDEFGDELDFLDLFDPFKIEQIYVYEGEEEINIAGNMRFDLYFSTNLPIKLGFNDQIEITVLLNQVQIKNVTSVIDPSFFGGKIQKQTIFIEDFDFKMEGGDELLFSIRMLPGDKPFGSFIKNRDLNTILERAELLADSLINQDLVPSLQEFGQIIKEFVNASGNGDVNLTLEDIAELVNALRASSFVFGSSQYPSSVTLPSKISDNENIKVLFLRDEGRLLEEKSENDEGLKVSLKNPQTWSGNGPNRYKILKEATANLYIDHRDFLRLLNLGRATVNATLSYGGITIGTSEIELEKTTVLNSIIKNIEPKVLTFDFPEIEIENDKDFTLEIGVPTDTRFGPLDRGIYRNIDLIYDSFTYPSSLSLQFAETDYIKMQLDTENNQDIITGGYAEYILNITSEFVDNVSIDVRIKDQSGNWSFEHPDSVTISPNKNKIVIVKIIHNNPELAAYNRDYIEIELEAAGVRGFASSEGFVSVKKEAVDFDVDVEYKKSKEIKHGEKGTIKFTIKNNNTGILPDSYIIDGFSENDWSFELEYDDSAIENVDFLDDFIVEATISVPSYTDVSTDIFTLNITSIESGIYSVEKTFEIPVKIKVILPNALEHFYHSFENAAEALGLDDVLGDFAAAFLLFIVFFLIFIFLVVIIIFLRRKYVDIICLDRIKEIDPDSSAIYDIEIHNPTKEKLTYEIFAEKQSDSKGWEISFDPITLSIDSKKSHFVKLKVSPTDYASSLDWIEIRIVTRTLEKNKVNQISVVSSIKADEPVLDISGVYHWPKIFKKGSLVKTSFRVRNNGRVSAKNVNIILNINGKQKNKVEDITIPRGGYAEIELPWIAVKGKNHLDIVIN
jgi:hypothetical protein